MLCGLFALVVDCSLVLRWRLTLAVFAVWFGCFPGFDLVVCLVCVCRDSSDLVLCGLFGFGFWWFIVAAYLTCIVLDCGLGWLWCFRG